MSEIVDFLKGQTGRVFSVKEVSREVSPDRYERDQTWASSELKKLCNKGLIEAINGCYWIPPDEDKNASRLEDEQEESEKVQLEALSGEDPPPEKTDE